MYPSMLKPSGDLFADFAQLQDRIDELMSGGQGASSIRAVSRAGAFPALNVGTWAEALEVYAFAPGIDPKSIDVSVEKGLLTLSGQRKSAEEAGKNTTVYAKERFEGAFRRVISLPEDSDPSRVEASYRNGVLKVVVPRLEAAKPRQIPVNR
jgi:HSP20 family protein